MRDIANTTVVIMCYPGYNGGQHVFYVVYKAGMFSSVAYTFALWKYAQ